MASTYFSIQDRTIADRKFKNLTHQLWDHFLEFLRSGTPSTLLEQFILSRNLPTISGAKFMSSSPLSAIPTPQGLKVYVPGKGDFFYREELVDGKRPAFVPGAVSKYGIVDIAGHHNGKTSFLYTWNQIFPLIQNICDQVIKDFAYFEKTDITDPNNADFKLEYAACEIQSLLPCARFYLACAANSYNTGTLNTITYQFAMTEMNVIGLLLYQIKSQATIDHVQQWLKACPEPFDIVPSSAGDCGGMSAFVSIFGLKIETRNRGGIRIPGERRTKYIKSAFAGLHINSSGKVSTGNVSGSTSVVLNNSRDSIPSSSSSTSIVRQLNESIVEEGDDELTPNI